MDDKNQDSRVNILFNIFGIVVAILSVLIAVSIKFSNLQSNVDWNSMVITTVGSVIIDSAIGLAIAYLLLVVISFFYELHIIAKSLPADRVIFGVPNNNSDWGLLRQILYWVVLRLPQIILFILFCVLILLINLVSILSWSWWVCSLVVLSTIIWLLLFCFKNKLRVYLSLVMTLFCLLYLTYLSAIAVFLMFGGVDIEFDKDFYFDGDEVHLKISTYGPDKVMIDTVTYSNNQTLLLDRRSETQFRGAPAYIIIPASELNEEPFNAYVLVNYTYVASPPIFTYKSSKIKHLPFFKNYTKEINESDVEVGLNQTIVRHLDEQMISNISQIDLSQNTSINNTY